MSFYNILRMVNKNRRDEYGWWEVSEEDHYEELDKVVYDETYDGDWQRVPNLTWNVTVQADDIPEAMKKGYDLIMNETGSPEVLKEELTKRFEDYFTKIKKEKEWM